MNPHLSRRILLFYHQFYALLLEIMHTKETMKFQEVERRARYRLTCQSVFVERLDQSFQDSHPIIAIVQLGL